MLLALLAACTQTPPSTVPSKASRPGWVVLYYIPYDNDLGPMAPAVLEQIRAGTAGGGVEAAALVDLPGPGGVSLTMFADGVGRPLPDLPRPRPTAPSLPVTRRSNPQNLAPKIIGVSRTPLSIPC